MSEVDFKSIEQKLGILIRLNAYLVTKDMKVAKAAPILSDLGLSSAEIAIILGSTSNAVNVRISEAKTAKKNAKAKK